MRLDPRTPVIIGVGQSTQREADPTAAREPIDLLAEAARLAAEDTGRAGAVVGAVDTTAVVDLVSWRYPDPGALLARRLGAEPRETITTTVGGNSPQLLVEHLAGRIARNESDVALLGGAECVYTRWRARRQEPKAWLAWTEADDPPCPVVIGDARPGSSAYEMAHLALAPTQVYPLFETALRAEADHGVGEHQAVIGRLWSTLAAVAAQNPYAWTREAYTPTEVITPSPDNRVVAFPYVKRMCANVDVDQAAAVVICSYEAARRVGVADDRMVFPVSSAAGHDHHFFTERASLTESPAIRAVGRAALDAAGIGIDDVAHLDLYSCFPSAVQIAMRALGLRGPDGGDSRPLTQTGGLPFAGGPLNNYVTHSIAATVEACRADPGSVGLVTALGWYITKHAIGTYSTRPPEGGFVSVDPGRTQAEIDALERREVATAFTGTATVEATSVVFDRDGTPNLGIVTALTADGRRLLANLRDVDALSSMTVEAWEGRTVSVALDGDTHHIVS